MYNYMAVGVILSVITIIVVSLFTRKPSSGQLSLIRKSPVDDIGEFSRSSEII